MPILKTKLINLFFSWKILYENGYFPSFKENSLHNPVPQEDGSAAAAQAWRGTGQGHGHLVSGRINLAFVEVTAFQLQGKSKDVTEQMTVIASERLPSHSIKCPKINFIFHSQLKAECARTLELL